jgi:hypothetical protein
MQTRDLSKGQVNCSSVGIQADLRNQAHWLLRLPIAFRRSLKVKSALRLMPYFSRLFEPPAWRSVTQRAVSMIAPWFRRLRTESMIWPPEVMTSSITTRQRSAPRKSPFGHLPRFCGRNRVSGRADRVYSQTCHLGFRLGWVFNSNLRIRRIRSGLVVRLAKFH